LEMGSVHSCVYGTLDWDAQSLSYGTYDNSYARSILDACIGCTSVTIEPREAHFRLEAVEKRDALLGEVATIPLSLICEEDGPVDSIRLDWCLPAKEDTKEALFFINEENDFVTSDSKILKYNTPQSPPFKVRPIL
uniref:Integrin_alpha2 domain-containing protein n=1 Tax=Gongylonema pulchrum TaxID=637853 RepID=A0A183DEX5_9BILA